MMDWETVANVFYTGIWPITLFLFLGLCLSYLWQQNASRAYQVLFLALVASLITPVLSHVVKVNQWGWLHRPVVTRLPHEKPAPLPEINTLSEPTAAKDTSLKENRARGMGSNAIIGSSANKEEAKTRMSFPWKSFFVIFWLILSLVFLYRFLASLIYEMKTLRKASPLHDKGLFQALQKAGEKTESAVLPNVYLSSAVKCPVICGWGIRPSLVLPYSYKDYAKEEDLLGVLIHEMIHIKRGDHISTLLIELFHIVYPWHPLLYWVRNRMARLSEMACDDQVLQKGYSAEKYAETLLHLLPQTPPRFALTAVGGRKRMEERLENLFRHTPKLSPKERYWRWGANITMMVLAILLSFMQTGSTQKQMRSAQHDRFEGSNDPLPHGYGAVLKVPQDFSTIQEAIDAASNGDKVLIDEGNYRTNIAIDKSIHLQGSGKYSTHILALNKKRSTILVQNSYVTMSHMTVSHGLHGIKTDGYIRNLELQHCQIINNTKAGLRAFRHGGCFNISHCLFAYNYYGIKSHQFDQGLVQHCVFYHNQENGMDIGWGNQTRVVHNIAIGNTNGTGLRMDSMQSSIVEKNITLLNESGIGIVYAAKQNAIKNNVSLYNNQTGIIINHFYCSNNQVYHNDILYNQHPAADCGKNNVWDVDYPRGGNFWSEYEGEDRYHGLHQNQSAGDGIGDTPYMYQMQPNKDYLVDHYPLMNPLNFYAVTIEVNPDSLSKENEWITVSVESASDLKIEDIDRNQLWLNGVIPPANNSSTLGDYDQDGIPDLMLQFDRERFVELCHGNIPAQVFILGRVNNGKYLVGKDSINK